MVTTNVNKSVSEYFGKIKENSLSKILFSLVSLLNCSGIGKVQYADQISAG